jgi:hypothetical protein
MLSKSSTGNPVSIIDGFQCFFLPNFVLIFYILGWQKASRRLGCQAIPLWLFLPISQSLRVSMWLSKFSWLKFKLRHRYCWWLTTVIWAPQEAEITKITVQGHPGQIVCKTPSSKITRKKWNGGMVQVAEHLLCKHRALSSNSNPIPPTQKHPNQTKTTLSFLLKYIIKVKHKSKGYAICDK